MIRVDPDRARRYRDRLAAKAADNAHARWVASLDPDHRRYHDGTVRVAVCMTCVSENMQAAARALTESLAVLRFDAEMTRAAATSVRTLVERSQ